MENGKRIRFASNSAVIDFLIVRYNPSKKTVYIWSFEVTIMKRLEKKIDDLKIMYEKLDIKGNSIGGIAL
jgi:hypothetical protein